MSERPLRIALLTHSVNPRGGVVHTIELADALHDAGHDVTVLAPATPGQVLFREPRCRVELVPVAAPAHSTLQMVESRIDAYVAHLSALLQRVSFDVLHAQDSISGNALATLVERGLIRGYVRTVHHLDTFSDPRLMAYQRRAMLRASQVLCVSRLWRDTLRREHGIAAALCNNGVDCVRYTPRRDANDARVTARYGLWHAPMLLAIGGIEERKNTLRILDAFVALRSAHPDAQLVVAGGASLLDHDRYAQRFHAEVAASGLASGPGQPLVLTGPVPDADMPALYRAADVLLMPSLREGFGLVVLEALASGTPVVVSRVPPFTEYLDDADVCFADPSDAASITAAVQRALQPARAAALAHKTPAVCLRYSWTRSAARHEALYRMHFAATHVAAAAATDGFTA